jgi:hypothetical protein
MQHRIGTSYAVRLGMCMLCLLAAVAVALLPGSPLARSASSASSAPATPNAKNTPFCNRLGSSIQASQGAQMYCFGPQANGAARSKARIAGPTTATKGHTPNVDAATPQEDVSPSGVQAFGQSEVSIASAGPYVVEAWNDATGFFALCGSPMNKEELTGFGFSTDGGATFTDLGGLPNNNCDTSRYEGDPSVQAYTVGGSTYFYISSIFIPFSVPENALAMTACKVTGSGSSATLSCGQPIITAISSDCQTFSGFTFCSFLDKEFLSIDPARGRLYMSYTEFGTSFPNFNGVIELATCDLSNPASPTCHNGSDGGATGAGAPAAPYFVVAPGDQAGCENEGAYPAVDQATGDVYVAYEHNWATNIFGCFPGPTGPTQIVLNHVPASCLTLTSTSPCSGPDKTAAANIVSMDAAFIPGYNRFPMNDFPRIAVSGPAGTVSIVWNDARLHPAGDIFVQSYQLGSLAPVQAAPVQLNSSAGGWHMLPAVSADGSGTLNVSFYGRSSANTAVTDVFAALRVDPRTLATPRSNTLVTSVASDWNAVSSDIVPNFGDYTDNYVLVTPGRHSASSTLFVAWSDGRLGLPQPFEANMPTG